MAGDWIKMRTDLKTHPKVVRISYALQADVLRTVGGLWSVWCLFDLHSEDGRMHGYSLEIIDSIIGWIGFSEQMMKVGWLEIEGEEPSQVLVAPRFDEHNGRTAKRRAQEAKRVKKYVRNQYAFEADEKRTREEKRRVHIEEDKSSSSATDAKASWSAESAWTISDSLLVRLQTAYPACDILAQAARAHEWLMANPQKRKKDYHRFLVNWLSRAQERGGDVASNRPGLSPRASAVMSALDHAAQVPVKNPPPPGWRELLLERADEPDMVPERWEDCFPSIQSYARELYERKGVATA